LAMDLCECFSSFESLFGLCRLEKQIAALEARKRVLTSGAD